MMKRALVALSLLVVSVVMVALVVPRIMSKDTVYADTGFLAPAKIGAATSTPFQPLLVFNASPTAAANSPNKNCTYTLYYWKLHPEAWPEQIVINGQVITKNQASALLNTNSQDPSIILNQELYGAFLNFFSGANPAPIQKTVLDSTGWLSENPPGTSMSEFNRQRGLDLAALLEQYNNGEFGPPLCSDQPPTPQPAISLPTETPAPTASPTLTRRPYEPPPTLRPTKTQPPRIVRPTITSQAPTQPPPSPTSRPPTQPPPTQVPLPTSVPTQVPIPTPPPAPTSSP